MQHPTLIACVLLGPAHSAQDRRTLVISRDEPPLRNWTTPDPRPPFPTDPLILNCRITDLDTGDSTPTIFGSDVARYMGSTHPLRVVAGTVVGLRGVSENTDPWERSRNLSGWAKFEGGSSLNVPLIEEPSGNYKVVVTGDANETFWVTDRLPTQFTVHSSNSLSEATVNWILIGGFSWRRGDALHACWNRCEMSGAEGVQISGTSTVLSP